MVRRVRDNDRGTPYKTVSSIPAKQLPFADLEFIRVKAVTLRRRNYNVSLRYCMRRDSADAGERLSSGSGLVKRPDYGD